MSDTNEHSLSLSFQIRRAIKAEDELQVAQAQVKLLTDQWNALPIKELVVNADYREMWQRQLKMNQQLNAALSAEKQAQPERAPLSDEQDRALCEAYYDAASDEYFKVRPQLESDLNRRIFYAGHRYAWINYETAHGIKQGGQHD